MLNIDPQALQQFILKKVGADMTKSEAQQLGVEKQYLESLEDAEIDSNLLDINDFSNDLVEEFRVMYVEEANTKKDNAAKDKEKEKEEQVSVKGKNGTTAG